MYDLAIIGAGPAGIECAQLAVKNGLKAVLLDRGEKTFGGTCLNQGCIPTKFFINSAKSLSSWQETVNKKDEVVEGIKKPLLKYLQTAGVEIKWGEVSFVDKGKLKAGEETVTAKNIIIATGSVSKKIISHKKAVLAQDIFDLPRVGAKFLVIGAGYIGIEIASLLNSLGGEVLVVEEQSEILPYFNRYFSSRLKVILERQRIKIQTSKSFSDYNLDDFDLILSAVGRCPADAGLDTSRIGLVLNRAGWIQTDQRLKTNIDNIYACGDITGKKLLAYTAQYQAKICIDNILGKDSKENYDVLPECVFSTPQLAKVGILEEEAKKRNLKYRVIKSNFLKFSSAYVYGDKDGFIQVLIDDNDRIIGAGIISKMAAELIGIFSLAIKNNLTVKNLSDCAFIHPTLSEIIPLLLV